MEYPWAQQLGVQNTCITLYLYGYKCMYRVYKAKDP